MEEIFDRFEWTKENKTIIHDKHLVDGLGNFTFSSFSSAPPGKPMHFHTGIMEIFCLVKGSRSTVVEDRGVMSTYTYNGNQIFLIYPGEHHGSADLPEKPCEFYGLQLDFRRPDHLLGLDRAYSQVLCSKLLSLKHRQYQCGSSHIQYLRTAFNFFATLDPESVAAGLQFLCAFLFSLPMLTPAEDVHVRNIDNGIQSAIDYIRENIQEPLKLETLAKISGYSMSYFKLKFRNETGITPAEYVTLQKMEAAGHLLSGTSQSITDIAYSLGFSTSNYFSTAFRKYYQMTPREYRKMQGQSE